MIEPGTQLRSGAWQDVDGSTDPNAFIDYLDEIATAQRGRFESLVLLGLGPGRAALDIGCGAGEVATELSRVVTPTGRVVGLDASRAMVAIARTRARDHGGDAEFVVGDAHDLAFADASFDAIHCDRVLQHLDRPNRAIAEMARVLAPRGVLMIQEPDWDALLVDATDASTTRAVRDSMMANIRQPQIGRSLRGLVLDAGLDVIDFNGALGVYAVSRAAADRVWGLGAQLEHAVARATIDRAAAEAWWSDLGVRDDAGRFFAGVVGFRVVARKP